MYTATIIAALLASGASLVAAGQATVNNYCSYNVVVNHVDGNGQQGGVTIGSNGGRYVENISGSGVSIKLTRDGNVYGGNENELDYSLATGTYGGLYWSLGSNGAPFLADGFEVVASSGQKVLCAAGASSCPSGTNWAPQDASLTVNLCRTN